MNEILNYDRIRFFNREYIDNNTIDNRILTAQGIDLHTNEIFVRYSEEYPNYFISPYSRAISYINGVVKEIKLGETGLNGKYLSFSMSCNGKKKTITINRAVADVFCPNYWGNKPLNAHHCDINTRNNVLTNLVLLPTDLHTRLHQIKSIDLLKDGKIIPVPNPLDLIIISNGVLTLEDIIKLDKRKKPLKSIGGRTVFNIKGYQIAYRFYPTKQE